KKTLTRLEYVMQVEWGERLIQSWQSSGWLDMPARVGNKIARLIGAREGEVIVADSTSLNLFKTLAAGLALRPQRRVILSTPDNFPTDLYMAQGLIHHLGDKHELRLVDDEDFAAHINEEVALVMLTHVNYKTGRLYDMTALTRRAHEQGALILWDLAHSAGAVPVDLHGSDVDFAVGCGYKYLNGGPGAPAFLFVASQHQSHFHQPLSGWMGHADPFAFDPVYTPADGIGRYLCGTPPILSLSALECGVDQLLDVDMHLIREKSLALTDYFIELVEARGSQYGLELVTPRERNMRGSQISIRYAASGAVMQALHTHGVIGDFRPPDILRFGFTPLYLRYVDVWDAVEKLDDLLATRSWEHSE
ncbi:MAG TPA: kynureninase, partial [Ktedonobacteraceae bacterium]|nr:kynureninase [Ktedonobacteraceae bacterium]